MTPRRRHSMGYNPYRRPRRRTFSHFSTQSNKNTKLGSGLGDIQTGLAAGAAGYAGYKIGRLMSSDPVGSIGRWVSGVASRASNPFRWSSSEPVEPKGVAPGYEFAPGDMPIPEPMD